MEPTQPKGKWRGRLIRYAPLFLWTGVILTLSTGAGSINRTSLIVGPLLNFLFPAASAETILFYHSLVRKAAHVFEYGVLALLALWAFRPSHLPLLSNRPYIAAITFIGVIAVVDEFQQSFDPSRTGTVYDVGLDLLGGALALTIAWILYRRRPQVPPGGPTYP